MSLSLFNLPRSVRYGKNRAAIVRLPVLATCKQIKMHPGQAVISAFGRANLRTTVQITIDQGLNRTLFQLPCTKFRNTILQRIPL